MPLPKREEIESRARQIKYQEEVRRGLPMITSEREELSEAGYIRRAQEDLMRRKSAVFMQQRQYMDEMASEMGLVVISRREHKRLEKHAGWRDFLKRRGLSVVSFRRETPIRARVAPIKSVKKAKKALTPKDLSKVKYRTTHGINGVRPKPMPPRSVAQKRGAWILQREYPQVPISKRPITITADDLMKTPMIGLRGGIPIPKSKKPKRKLKKRKVGKIASNRNGRKPRKLKGFVFGDDVWKVRTRRRKKR